MKLIFHPEPEVEYLEAIVYYNEKLKGSAATFHWKLRLLPHRSLKCLIDGQAWMKMHRYLMHRFPYGLLSTIEDGYILVVAVMHLRRQPGYWQDCING